MLLDQINLSTRERIDYRIRYLLYGGTAVLIAMLSLVNLTQGYQLHRERVGYQRKLVALQTQARKLEAAGNGRDAFDPKAYQALAKQGLAGNRLIALDLFPWVSVLNALENALPDAVIIDSFQPADGFRRIDIEGRTESLEKLVLFRKRLEEAGLVASVVLENMGIGGGQESSSIDSSYRTAFKLHCRLRLERVFPEETHGALWQALKPTGRKK